MRSDPTSLEALFNTGSNFERTEYEHLLIDGSGLTVSAWASGRHQQFAEDRVNTAIYVSLRTVHDLVDAHLKSGGTTRVVYDGYDSRKPRRGLHPWYKHGRSGAINREEIGHAQKILESLFQACGVPSMAVRYAEADDVIASMAVRHRLAGDNVLIYSNDKDYLQLVCKRVHLWRHSDGRLTTPQTAEIAGTMTGVAYLQVKAMMGDPGDNIRGLPGIGEKTAQEIIGAIPHFMPVALGEADQELTWDALSDKTRRRLLKSGRLLAFPPTPLDLAFAKQAYPSRAHHLDTEATEEAAFDAVLQEAARNYRLVEMMTDIEYEEASVLPNLAKARELLDQHGLLREDILGFVNRLIATTSQRTLEAAW